MVKNKCCRTCGCPRMADEPSPKNPSSEGEEARRKINQGLKEAKAGKLLTADEHVQNGLASAHFQRAQRANRTGRRY